jgi:hypothetical protein
LGLAQQQGQIAGGGVMGAYKVVTIWCNGNEEEDCDNRYQHTTQFIWEARKRAEAEFDWDCADDHKPDSHDLCPEHADDNDS